MGLLITCTLVTTLYATAMTIANVSLPQIQGALSAGPDQVAWVVTANLIATAVTIPLAGWMSNRFGRRRVMIFGVAGFAVSTLLCGLSSSLEALILWRVFQSAFCSPLAAVAQSVVIDEFPGEQRPRAVAIFMMGVGIAPTIAPLLGGYVCEILSWSWVFYIMLPIAILAFFGLFIFVRPDPPKKDRAELDWIGFLSLVAMISSIQLVLDRGEREEWLSSLQIVFACFCAVISGWIFITHSLTKERPLIDLRLFTERNFVLGILIHAIFGMLFITPMVLMPSLLQQLQDVPEFKAGSLIAIRGAATTISMLLMVWGASKWDPRLLLLFGFGTHTYAGFTMAGFDMNTSFLEVSWVMFAQGFGVGCLWVPMTLVTFSNLALDRSAEGAMMWNLVRSIASSFYISLSFIVIFHTQKMSYRELAQWIIPFDDRFEFGVLQSFWNSNEFSNLLQLSSEVTRQAANIGYINVFHLFLWASILAYPLILLISWPPKGSTRR